MLTFSLFQFRKELSELWDKCFFGPAQREEFTPAFDGKWPKVWPKTCDLWVFRKSYRLIPQFYSLSEKICMQSTFPT